MIRIAFISTGGTIATLADDPTDLVEYGTSGRIVTAAELLMQVPEVQNLCRSEAHTLGALESTHVTPATWAELQRLIMTIVRRSRPPAGIVVGHGTSTLEETAYFLHLTVRSRVPIVIVGAQRPLNATSSDAPVNLLNGFAVASSRDTRGMGVVAVMDGEIHSAREVRKAANYGLAALSSGDLGPLGLIEPTRSVSFLRRTTRLHTTRSHLRYRSQLTLPYVEIVTSYVGSEGEAIRAAVANGARGIVVAGFPPGVTTPGDADAISVARRAGVIVVQASRIDSGGVLRRSRFREQGVVAAGDLTPAKARILAALALRQTQDPEAIQAIFATH